MKMSQTLASKGPLSRLDDKWMQALSVAKHGPSKTPPLFDAVSVISSF